MCASVGAPLLHEHEDCDEDNEVSAILGDNNITYGSEIWGSSSLSVSEISSETIDDSDQDRDDIVIAAYVEDDSGSVWWCRD